MLLLNSNVVKREGESQQQCLHHDPHVPQVQGQAHKEVQEGHEAHTIDQHEQEVVLDALKSA
jgi:hypothetical protein